MFPGRAQGKKRPPFFFSSKGYTPQQYHFIYTGAVMKSFLTLKSVDEVLSLVETFERLPEEYVPLDESAGRYLARDWSAPEDLPGFDRSTVDGYAVRARDVFGAQEGSPALLECVGECPMGRTPDFSLEPGRRRAFSREACFPKGPTAW